MRIKAPTIDVFGDIESALKELSLTNKALSKAIKTIGTPHIRRRPGGYEGLFRIIVEQQVSVPSAQAILARCQRGLPEMTPEIILGHTDDHLKSFGLSGPKVKYVRNIAVAIQEGTLVLEDLASMDDHAAATHLCTVKGIGPWTAGIYLLFCEGRVDIWPKGDVALLAAYAAASGFSEKPPMKDFDAMADEWQPWRGVAAHVLWTYYAHLKGRTPI